MLPIGYKNRLPPPFSLIIKCYYVIEVCICERDSSCSGLVQRSLIISSQTRRFLLILISACALITIV